MAIGTMVMNVFIIGIMLLAVIPMPIVIIIRLIEHKKKMKLIQTTTEDVIYDIEGFLRKYLNTYDPDIYILECTRPLLMSDFENYLEMDNDAVCVKTASYTLKYRIRENTILGIHMIICKKSAYDHLLKYRSIEELSGCIILVVNNSGYIEEIKAIDKLKPQSIYTVDKSNGYSYEYSVLHNFIKAMRIHAMQYITSNGNSKVVKEPICDLAKESKYNCLTLLILSLTNREVVYEYVHDNINCLLD